MLHIVHHPGYLTPPPPSGSFPASKYNLLIAALDALDLPQARHVPEPMPRIWLEAVHAPAYVGEVLSAAVPRDKERRIGFPVTPLLATRAQLTPGGTWLAAKLALEHGYAANTAGAAIMRFTIPAPAIACSTIWPSPRTGCSPRATRGAS